METQLFLNSTKGFNIKEDIYKIIDTNEEGIEDDDLINLEAEEGEDTENDDELTDNENHIETEHQED